MATISNERDRVLQTAPGRTTTTNLPSYYQVGVGQIDGIKGYTTGARTVQLIADQQAFVVGSTGVPDRQTIRLQSVLSNVAGVVKYSIQQGGATLTVADNNATLDFANMSTDVVVVRAEVDTDAAQPPGPAPVGVVPVGFESQTWPLTFWDDFKGAMLDSARWNNYRTGETPAAVLNYKVENDCLHIWPTPEFAPRTICTQDKFKQKYAYVEIRARLPRGKGLMPWFWLWGLEGSDRAQIDIMRTFCGKTS